MSIVDVVFVNLYPESIRIRATGRSTESHIHPPSIASQTTLLPTIGLILNNETRARKSWRRKSIPRVPLFDTSSIVQPGSSSFSDTYPPLPFDPALPAFPLVR